MTKNYLVKVAIESELDLISAALIFFAAIIPAYLSLKLRGDIVKLTISLTAFIVIRDIPPSKNAGLGIYGRQHL